MTTSTSVILENIEYTGGNNVRNTRLIVKCVLYHVYLCLFLIVAILVYYVFLPSTSFCCITMKLRLYFYKYHEIIWILIMMFFFQRKICSSRRKFKNKPKIIYLHSKETTSKYTWL